MSAVLISSASEEPDEPPTANIRWLRAPRESIMTKRREYLPDWSYLKEQNLENLWKKSLKEYIQNKLHLHIYFFVHILFYIWFFLNYIKS